MTEQKVESDYHWTTPASRDLPMGTRVLAFPGTRDGRALITRTRSEVWRVGSFDVVAVEGYAGGIFIGHIEVLPDESASPESPRGGAA